MAHLSNPCAQLSSRTFWGWHHVNDVITLHRQSCRAPRVLSALRDAVFTLLDSRCLSTVPSRICSLILVLLRASAIPHIPVPTGVLWSLSPVTPKLLKSDGERLSRFLQASPRMLHQTQGQRGAPRPTLKALPGAGTASHAV